VIVLAMCRRLLHCHKWALHLVVIQLLPLQMFQMNGWLRTFLATVEDNFENMYVNISDFE
jgi:hypothetical protein